MNTFDLSLDLDKRAGVTQWVTMRQGDHDGTQLRATIYDHGTQVSDSYTCRVSIRKPTDNEYYRETCSFSGGVAIVTVDEQYAASEVGITYGYFELLQGTAVIASTENFGVRILQSAIDGAIVAPPYDSAIEDALAELDEATGRISQMVQDATAEYLEAHPEITTTVQDNSLTDAKLIQKGGILQREQWLETMLPNIPRKTTSEADVHSVTDSAGGGPLGISVYGRSTQDGTPTPDAPVPIVSVGPNYVGFSDKVTSSSNGITWSAGEGGRLKAVGTATGNSYAVGTPTDADLGKSYIPLLPAGTYTATSYWQVEFNVYSMPVGSASGTSLRNYSKDDFTFTLTEPRYVQLGVRATEGVVTDTEYELSIYEGSVRHPYTPKGSVGLLATGRNMLDIGSTMYSANRCTYEVTDTGITLTGNATTSYCYVNLRLVGLRGTCTLHFDVQSDLGHAVQVSSDVGALIQRSEITTATFTVPEDANYVTLYLYVKSDSSGTHTATFTNVQLEQSSAATPYQPYVETTIPIDLGGRSLRSLPDGTRDEVNVDEWGHAILTQRVGEVDLGTLTWGYQSATGLCYSNGYPPMVANTTNCRITNGYSILPSQSSVLSTDYSICKDPNGRLYVNDSRYTDAASVQAGMGGVILLYPLATPQTIDLGHLDPAMLPAPDLTAYVVPSAPSVLRYGFDVAQALAELATA